MKWYQSLKTHIVSALILQLILVMAMASFSVFELSLRKHDYAILNLIGQLRVMAQNLVIQSSHYKKAAPRDYESYQRDLNLYHKNIQKQIKSYTEILDAFNERKLPTRLTGQAEVINCNWDDASVYQLNKTIKNWKNFNQGLNLSIGENLKQPRLEYAAEFIVDNGSELVERTDKLAAAFQKMMELKLDSISRFNTISIVIFVFINMGLLIVFYKKVFQPLDITRDAFEKVANGNLNKKIEVNSNNEIGEISHSFNALTQRLSSMLRLTERIHQANNLDESLSYFHEEFKLFLPIEWVALMRCVPESDEFVLERIYTDIESDIYENEKFDIYEPLLHRAIKNKFPVNINLLESNDSLFLKELKKCGLLSVTSIPMDCLNNDIIILVIATTKENAYQDHHMELLKNLTVQLSHGLDKTIGMEGLIVSAIEGLAKLAESRDPETGGHLTRMSMYSAIISDQLLKDSVYAKDINPAYIRDVLRFSPMHDIGKVGIEDSILLKPGLLTEDERHKMQAHPQIGADVLKHCERQMNCLGRSVFKVGIEITQCHHEKYDGSGYPFNLKGQDIPLSARIVAVADVFDALTSKRPYKNAWSIDLALMEMRQESGKHFDPLIIDALEKAMPEIMSVYEEYKHT